MGPVLAWYAVQRRDLPWRRPDAGPWGVLVSEVMLQQTPVARVLPAYAAWMRRWPSPASLAAHPAGEAVRQWGRLGYPRRALRLHAAAGVLLERHAGSVPSDLDSLLALPGLGAYSARAVAAFAFGQAHPVVDTNVRRVVARAAQGMAAAGPPSPAADLRRMQQLMPADPALGAGFAAGVMELGAVICTARTPACLRCPLTAVCSWRQAGCPAPDAAQPAPRPRPRPRYEGSDRQVRGQLLQLLRRAEGPLGSSELAAAWHLPDQRERALLGLIADGLAERDADGRVRLP